MTPEIETVVAGLTAAQRRALMGRDNVDMAAGTASALVRAGCIILHPYDPDGWAWSEFAHAVRAALQGQPS